MTKSNFRVIVVVVVVVLTALLLVRASQPLSGDDRTRADFRAEVVFPGPVWPVGSTILYGGVLRDKQMILDVKSAAVQKLLQAILSDIPGGNDSSYIPSGDFTDVEVLNATKSRLVYTLDDRMAMFHEFADRSKEGRWRHHRKIVIMGLLYTVTVRWVKLSVSEVLTHHLAVTRDRQKQYHIYQHTRSCEKVLDTSAGSCSADARDCVDGSSAGLAGSRMLSVVREADSSQLDEDYMRYRCDVPSSSLLKSQLEQGELIFMSYNIWNFNTVEMFDDDYVARVHRLGRLFKQHMPAVLAFQEVRYDFEHGGTLGHSQMTHLANLLPGYQYVFQPAMSYPRGIFGRVEEGVAIFSAYPILSHDYILLTRDLFDSADNHQRILLHAEIATPQIGHVHVFVTHLSLSEAARNRSVVEIWKYMEKFKGVRILAGDLNAEPHSAAVQFLAGKVEIGGVHTSGLQDAWTMFFKEPRPDVPGTYDDFEERDAGLTFSTMESHLVKRIDYVFVDLANHATMTNISLAGTRWEEATSDHLGLVGTFMAKMP